MSIVKLSSVEDSLSSPSYFLTTEWSECRPKPCSVLFSLVVGTWLSWMITLSLIGLVIDRNKKPLLQSLFMEMALFALRSSFWHASIALSSVFPKMTHRSVGDRAS